MLGLMDTPGSMEELILDVDDNLINREKRSISRSDVANLCVAALMRGEGNNVSFDAIAAPVEEGATVKDADTTLSEFLATCKTANYDN